MKATAHADRKQLLLDRVDAIGRSLEATGEGLALLALGSVGLETDRLDEYSDLDFFAIVRDGSKRRFLDSLDWLQAASPIAYAFQNTVDGYKVLFEDGVLGEFAVFEPPELASIPFAKGRIAWKVAGFDDSLGTPQRTSDALPPRSADWLVGETLTNLYVGMCRYRRGEKLSAFRFIQVYAVDHIIDLSAQIVAEQPAYRDGFAHERRYEQRFPDIAAHLPRFTQGYERSGESARALLHFLDEHFEVNGAIKAAILKLCDGA